MSCVDYTKFKKLLKIFDLNFKRNIEKQLKLEDIIEE